MLVKAKRMGWNAILASSVFAGRADRLLRRKSGGLVKDVLFDHRRLDVDAHLHQLMGLKGFFVINLNVLDDVGEVLGDDGVIDN